jgi:Spy/CpxP family protein refolding chaperone
MHYVKQLILVAALSINGSICAMPQDNCDSTNKCRKMENGIVLELGLNADQNAKLKTLHSEMKIAHKEHIEKIKALREKSREELLKPKPDKTVLYGFAGEIGALQKIMAEKEADHLLKIKAILTPEQFDKLLSRNFTKKVGPPPQDEHGPDDK